MKPKELLHVPKEHIKQIDGVSYVLAEYIASSLPDMVARERQDAAREELEKILEYYIERDIFSGYLTTRGFHYVSSRLAALSTPTKGEE